MNRRLKHFIQIKENHLIGIFAAGLLIAVFINLSSVFAQTAFEDTTVFFNDYSTIQSDGISNGFKVGNDNFRQCCYVVIPDKNVLEIKPNSGTYLIYIKAYIPAYDPSDADNQFRLMSIYNVTGNPTDALAAKTALKHDEKLNYDYASRTFVYTIDSSLEPYNDSPKYLRLKIQNSSKVRDLRSQTFYIKEIKMINRQAITSTPSGSPTSTPTTSPVDSNYQVDLRIKSAPGYSQSNNNLAMPSKLPASLTVSKVEYLNNGWNIFVTYSYKQWVLQGLNVEGEDSKAFSFNGTTIWLNAYTISGTSPPSKPSTVAATLLSGVVF